MTLTPETVAVNSRFFDNDVNKVPKQAMSVGVATIMDSHEVIIQAFGHKKARALKHGVEGATRTSGRSRRCRFIPQASSSPTRRPWVS